MRKIIYTLFTIVCFFTWFSISTFAQKSYIPIPSVDEIISCSINYLVDYTIDKKDYNKVLNILSNVEPIEPISLQKSTVDEPLSVYIESKLGKYYYNFGKEATNRVTDIITEMQDSSQNLNYQYQFEANMKDALISLVNGYIPDIKFDNNDVFILNETQKTAAVCSSSTTKSLENCFSNMRYSKSLQLKNRCTDYSTIEIQNANYKTVLDLYENGVKITWKSSKISDTNINTTNLACKTQEEYKKLLKIIKQCYITSRNKIPLWFAIVNPSKINSATIYDQSNSITDTSDNPYTIEYVLKNFYINGDGYRKGSNKDKIHNANKITIDFTNNIKYTIYLDKTSIVITSSDLSYSLKFTYRKNKVIDDLLKDGFEQYDTISNMKKTNQNLNPIKPDVVTG